MNNDLIKLKNKNMFTNKEMFSFLMTSSSLLEDLANKLPDGSGESESPDVILVRSSGKSLLLTSISTFKSNFKNYESALNLPRKFIETDKMFEINKIRLLIFGTIKKMIYNVYMNDKENVNAQKLWFLVRIYKNLSKLKSTAVHSNLYKFVEDIESDMYKEAAAALNITDEVAELKTKNIEFEKLLVIRSANKNMNYKSVMPFRNISESDYMNTLSIANSILLLDSITDYSEFVIKFNGHTQYFNNIANIKITRRKNKNKKNETIIDNLEEDLPQEQQV